ncbi:hypothetical protein Pint_24231 [Pistacia integerrima]|uniref:Uncharacterized protein n=1 Tax=Pistacia integerrima TaxID=434235 RepID=A0ACC0YBT8_9ROSI|nr:hypothetical protein Pint_24231 [Pistacia integerrima]
MADATSLPPWLGGLCPIFRLFLLDRNQGQLLDSSRFPEKAKTVP